MIIYLCSVDGTIRDVCIDPLLKLYDPFTLFSWWFGARGDTGGGGGGGGGGCKINQIVFLGENEIGADFDTLTSLVTVQ